MSDPTDKIPLIRLALDLCDTGMSMSLLLLRLAKLSDERDQQAARQLVAQWDLLMGLPPEGVEPGTEYDERGEPVPRD